jgi:ABC transporter substrate binding protein
VRRRREFIALLGGAAAWPFAAHAQEAGRAPHVVIWLGGVPTDPVGQQHVSAFKDTMRGLGWIDGRNVRIDVRWIAASYGAEEMRAAAVDLVALKPDLIVTTGAPILEALHSLRAAARDLGLQVHVLRASTEREIDDAFAVLSQLKAGGVVIGPDVFFNTRSEQLGALASRHGVAAIYQYRAFTLAGGLMSYSGDIVESHRLAGGYTAQILKGEKPADLAVQQATKVELIINLETAKALGLTIPLPLIGRADEVIE